MPGEHAAGPLQSRTDNFGNVYQIELQLDRPGFEPCHVEQVANEAIEALGFAFQGGKQFIAFDRVVFVDIAPQARYGAEDRGERGSQIMRDRGQQRGTQSLGLGQHTGLRQSPR